MSHNSKIIVRSSTNITLNERFTQLRKFTAPPASSSSISSSSHRPPHTLAPYHQQPAATPAHPTHPLAMDLVNGGGGGRRHEIEAALRLKKKSLKQRLDFSRRRPELRLWSSAEHHHASGRLPVQQHDTITSSSSSSSMAAPSSSHWGRRPLVSRISTSGHRSWRGRGRARGGWNTDAGLHAESGSQRLRHDEQGASLKKEDLDAELDQYMSSIKTTN